MLRTSEFVVNFMLNAGWQIAVIFAIAAVAGALMRNGPVRYRHTLWVVALVASLVVPLLTASRFVPAWISNLQASSVRINSTPVVTSNTNVADLNVHRTAPTRRKTVTTSSTRIVLFLAFAYALLICGRAIRLWRFWQRKEKLRRSATLSPLSPEIEAIAQRCRDLLNTYNARVAVSNNARVPYTIGTLRPLIVLPESFCTSADEARLLSVIGHEMAHVKRGDFLTNLICELIALPVWFHPLTFLLKRRIDRARELASDELVTAHVLAPKVYARSLLWAAHISSRHSSQAFMLSIFDGKILEERIVRIMRSNKRLHTGPARVITFAALSVLCLSALSLSMFSLELQTQARAAVTQTVELLAPAAPPAQHPVTPTNAAAVPRTEAQSTSASIADARSKSACEAGRRGDVADIPGLIEMLGDDSKSQPIKCWDSGRWSPALQTFRYPSPGEQAAIALASFGRAAFRPLADHLDSANPVVRRNAAWAIGELTGMMPGERASAVPQLITLLSDSDEWVRMASARALGEVRDQRALPQLLATLSDANWQVRELATWALSEMKDDRAVESLCRVLLSDVRAEVRRGAAEALGEIASSEALPSLRQALNDPEVSAKAAWAISEIEG